MLIVVVGVYLLLLLLVLLLVGEWGWCWCWGSSLCLPELVQVIGHVCQLVTHCSNEFGLSGAFATLGFIPEAIHCHFLLDDGIVVFAGDADFVVSGVAFRIWAIVDVIPTFAGVGVFGFLYELLLVFVLVSRDSAIRALKSDFVGVRGLMFPCA